MWSLTFKQSFEDIPGVGLTKSDILANCCNADRIGSSPFLKQGTMSERELSI